MGAAPVPGGDRFALGRGDSPLLPAHVQRLPSPPNTTGVIFASQASRRSSAAVVVPPNSS
jgi:hypothetical protein